MTERGDWWEVELSDENGISAGFYEKSLFQAFESAYLWFMSSKERKKKEDLLANAIKECIELDKKRGVEPNLE